MGDAGQVGQSHSLNLIILWLISLHLPSRISLLLSTPNLRMQQCSLRTPLSDSGAPGLSWCGVVLVVESLHPVYKTFYPKVTVCDLLVCL